MGKLQRMTFAPGVNSLKQKHKEWAAALMEVRYTQWVTDDTVVESAESVFRRFGNLTAAAYRAATGGSAGARGGDLDVEVYIVELQRRFAEAVEDHSDEDAAAEDIPKPKGKKGAAKGAAPQPAGKGAGASGDRQKAKAAAQASGEFCRQFQQGRCDRGAACWYKHGEPSGGGHKAHLAVAEEASDAKLQSLEAKMELMVELFTGRGLGGRAYMVRAKEEEVPTHEPDPKHDPKIEADPVPDAIPDPNTYPKPIPKPVPEPEPKWDSETNTTSPAP